MLNKMLQVDFKIFQVQDSVSGAGLPAVVPSRCCSGQDSSFALPGDSTVYCIQRESTRRGAPFPATNQPNNNVQEVKDS